MIATHVPRVKMSSLRTQNLLLEKRQHYLHKRFMESEMSNATRGAIKGDEIRLRRAIVLGFPPNSRDRCVSMIWIISYRSFILLRFVCVLIIAIYLKHSSNSTVVINNRLGELYCTRHAPPEIFKSFGCFVLKFMLTLLYQHLWFVTKKIAF